MKKNLLFAAALAVWQGAALADVVYVTARPTPSGTGASFDGTYAESGIAGSDTSAKGTALGVPPRDGCRFFSNSFSNAVGEIIGFSVTPTLGVPGGVYRIHHNFSSLAGNVSTSIVLTANCSFGGALSFSDTGTGFQRAAGNPANQWKFLGYLTNEVGSATPKIDFGYKEGYVNAGASMRLLVDTFRFILDDPCLDIPEVAVTGPLAIGLPTVLVTGVASNATAVTVYQDTGSGMVPVGSKASEVVAGNNSVAVTGLVKGAIVAATQTIDGQEGCVPTAGLLVGGGANPRIRLALSIRETSSTGPIGSAGVTTNSSLHFLGATGTLSGSPVGGLVVHPSNTWQTVTFDRGTVRVGDVSNVVGAASAGFDYSPGDTVSVRAYAFQTDPALGTPFFSAVPGQSAEVTSAADTFTATWTWDEVDGAEGYRLLRSVNGAEYGEYVDVFSATTHRDADGGWTPGAIVTPTQSQTNASIRWNPSTGLPNQLPGTWGVLDAIALVIDDLEDVGPFDLYLDNLQNGSTVWQTFEGSVAGTRDVSFRAPGFSGTTSQSLLAAPNDSIVANTAADTGTKSLRIRFQWAGTNATQWIRLTTSGVGNPQVNLDQPISFRLLLQPVGATPVAPPAPTLSAALVNGQTVLQWTDAHRLQAAGDVTGTFTNVPGVTLAPWTNSFAEPQTFFRLVD